VTGAEKISFWEAGEDVKGVERRKGTAIRPGDRQTNVALKVKGVPNFWGTRA